MSSITNSNPSDLEEVILKEIAANATIKSSTQFASKNGINHQQLVGVIKSLEMDEIIKTEMSEEETWELTSEGNSYLTANASPEIQVLKLISKQGVNKAKLKELLGGDKKAATVESVGYGVCMKNKWIKQEKSSEGIVAYRLVDEVKDEALELLQRLNRAEGLSDKDLSNLKKRKLVTKNKVKYFVVGKGQNFTVERKKAPADLSFELLQGDVWKNEKFKAYNFNAKGKRPQNGCLHPLLKVRTEFRKIFLEMGFEEMKTNSFVESSFWNFDTLFQPQAHPARDSHDTFFLKDPAEMTTFPEDYLKRVKDVHEKGGYGSVGYRYDWKLEEAKKNILRTHTTAVSSRYLYHLAQEYKKNGFQPKKFFSIDRVFRNEEPDATHLCEFHQIEGMVIDKGLSLGDMIGLFSTFFAKIGIKDLKFKPAYNPYTEPSMEIFGFHPQLDRWVEVGNSGVFRPEMLEPMGLPPDVTVLAWGLSLERPTMILYEIDNIKLLVGHKVPITNIQTNPLCRLDKQKKADAKGKEENVTA